MPRSSSISSTRRTGSARGEPPVGGHPEAEIYGRDQKCLDLCLYRLGNQPARARSQDFGERIIDGPFLTQGNNSILGHDVSPARRFGWLDHQPRYAAVIHTVTGGGGGAGGGGGWPGLRMARESGLAAAQICQ